MKRMRNWDKLVPTAEQIRASKRWMNFSEEARERAYMFFLLGHETFDLNMKESFMASAKRLTDLCAYCSVRSDQSLIIDAK